MAMDKTDLAEFIKWYWENIDGRPSSQPPAEEIAEIYLDKK